MALNPLSKNSLTEHDNQLPAPKPPPGHSTTPTKATIKIFHEILLCVVFVSIPTHSRKSYVLVRSLLMLQKNSRMILVSENVRDCLTE